MFTSFVTHESLLFIYQSLFFPFVYCRTGRCWDRPSVRAVSRSVQQNRQWGHKKWEFRQRDSHASIHHRAVNTFNSTSLSLIGDSIPSPTTSRKKYHRTVRSMRHETGLIGLLQQTDTLYRIRHGWTASKTKRVYSVQVKLDFWLDFWRILYFVAVPAEGPF